jgi:hypothetical protein
MRRSGAMDEKTMRAFDALMFPVWSLVDWASDGEWLNDQPRRPSRCVCVLHEPPLMLASLNDSGLMNLLGDSQSSAGASLR